MKQRKKASFKSQQHQTETGLSVKRKRIFSIILFLIPLVFLILIELTLSWLSYGGNLDLFISGPGRLANHYICNPDVARRYFATQKNVPTPPNDYFKKRKPANGFRVFVLGASTAYGYPFGYNLMFSRILENQLNTALPDRFVEVVNVSMPAINSYALLDFIDEILAQEPDAILIYAGHNEYYGAMGVGSMVNFGRNRQFVSVYMKLSRFKIFLAVRDLALQLRQIGQPHDPHPTATLMERMVSEPSIPLDSDLYKAGVRQFRGNLRTILRKTSQEKIPVFLSDLVCNLSDLEPFHSAEDAPSAQKTYQNALEFEGNQKYNLAKAKFKRARDLDAIRFRAPSEFNNIIHNLAEEFKVTFVPMEKTFESASPHGLVGDNLMTDHLHPTIEGYFLMEDAFFNKMQRAELIPKTSSRPVPVTELQQTWGYTKLDSICGELKIRVLEDGWPFRSRSGENTALEKFQPATFVEKIAKRVIKYDNYTIRHGHEELAEYFEKQGQSERVFQEYKALVTLKTFSPIPYLKLSEMLLETDNAEEIPPLVNQSLLFDESPLAYILLGEAYNALGQYNDAIAAFQYAQQLGLPPDDPHIRFGLHYAYNATGQMQKAARFAPQSGARSAGNAPVDIRKVNNLLRTADQLIREQKYEQARLKLKESLTLQESARAHKWIGQIYMEQKQFEQAVEHLERARELGLNEPLLLYNLSIALMQQQEYDRAYELLRELKQVSPKFGDPYNLKEKLEPLVHQ